MSDRHVLEEIRALKGETARLLGARAEHLAASGEAAKDIAADVKAFLSDLRDALALEEAEIERAFAGRTATALVSALALGVVIGYVLRRKS
jgi:F0F1-type ATP synthase assembly protein I